MYFRVAISDIIIIIMHILPYRETLMKEKFEEFDKLA